MYRYVQLFRYCNDYGGYNLFDSAKKATHLEASTVMMSVISINIFCTIKTLLTLRVLIPITWEKQIWPNLKNIDVNFLAEFLEIFVSDSIFSQYVFTRPAAHHSTS